MMRAPALAGSNVLQWHGQMSILRSGLKETGHPLCVHNVEYATMSRPGPTPLAAGSRSRNSTAGDSASGYVKARVAPGPMALSAATGTTGYRGAPAPPAFGGEGSDCAATRPATLVDPILMKSRRVGIRRGPPSRGNSLYLNGWPTTCQGVYILCI